MDPLGYNIMDESVKNFIEDNIDLIENNEFEKFFEIAYSNSVTVTISDFTTVFVDAGINFLDHMKSVPAWCFNNLRNIDTIVLPHNIESVEFSAFYGSSLKNISIPDSVKSIDHHAFTKTNLTSIVFPKSCSVVERAACSDCLYLKTATFEGNAEIGYSLFENCTQLETVEFKEGLKQLPSNTFKECTSLKDVYLPNSIEIIDTAFHKCSLVTIHYNGTMQEWSDIIKLRWKKIWCKKVICTDGIVRNGGVVV